jgi:hypothetical protein
VRRRCVDDGGGRILERRVHECPGVRRFVVPCDRLLVE